MPQYEARGQPKDFVFFLSSEWQRFHRPGMIRAMARHAQTRGGNVVIVDHPVCPITAPLKRRERWQRWRAHRGLLTPLADNLYLYDAHVLLHDKLASAVPGMGSLNRAVLQRQLLSVLRRLSIAREQLVSWFHFPTFHHYVGMLGESLAVYECYDEHTAITGLWQVTREHYRRLERQMLRKVDVVFTTSLPLYFEKSRLHARTFLSHNAADAAFFARARSCDLPVAFEVPPSRRPVVGYVGTLNEHTDLALLRHAARLRPNWTFVLVGPIQPGADVREIDQLKQCANVRMCEWAEGESLLALMKLIDVGVIPYKADSPFNRYSNPNKLHEYVASGKPVVSTRIGDLTTHSGFVTVADTPQEFVAAVDRAYAEDNTERVSTRLEIAAANSWDVRAAGIFERLSTLQARR